jgi:hypothetical protein
VSPQAPQLAFVRSGTSQPFATLPSQLPKLAAHAMVQAPRTQPAVPLVLLHTFPQAPQLFTLVCVFTSQPFEPSPSQLPKPAAHPCSVHVRDAHDAVAFAREQTVPHAPQSVRVARLASQPFAAFPSQSPNPRVQAWRLQVPLKQVAVAFANEQAFPHAPQLATLPLRFVSHPLSTLPSQSPKPDVQATWQAPLEQLGVPFVALQTVPHVPQFVVSSAVWISQPVAYERSQSA